VSSDWQIPPFPSGADLWASVLSPLNRVGQAALVPEVRFVAFLLDRFLAPLGQSQMPEAGGEASVSGSASPAENPPAQFVDVWSVAVFPTVRCPDLFFGASPWRWPGHRSSPPERSRHPPKRTHDDRDNKVKCR